MNILFRVDSSTEIGLGHLMRCLVLAEQYQKNNNIFFATQDLEKNANQNILDKNYKLISLRGNSIDELMQNINELKIEMVVFDHYNINEQFEKAIKIKTGVIILSLDDTYERHYCDILLNHNIYAKAENYKDLVPEFSELRCGEEYTLIRKDFKKLKIKSRPINIDNPVIFVSLGGSDVNNISLSVLKILSDFRGVSVNLATTSSNKNIDELVKFSKQYQHLNICIDCNVAELMNNSDFAIITPSVTTYEAMYLNLPFLAIKTADNQRYVSDYLASCNFLLGDVKKMNKVGSLIQTLLER